MSTILTVGVLILQDNHVLLVKHGSASRHINEMYGIPGGHVEEKETLLQAATRELQEETGLVAQEKDLAAFPNNEFSADIPRKDGTIKRYTMHIFIAKKYSGELQGNTETEPEWISLDKLDKFNLLPNVKRAIDAVLV